MSDRSELIRREVNARAKKRLSTEGRATSERIDAILQEEAEKEEAMVASGEAWVESLWPSIAKMAGGRDGKTVSYIGFTEGRRTFRVE